MSDAYQSSLERKAKVFNKKYASSISNIIKELRNAPEEQRKRWPWELIQNACDSIAKDPVRKSVDVTIDCYEDRVVFVHNGSPFTEDQFNALIYMYSEGKENNKETTGQFGTGFCSTHVLSCTVGIETNIRESDEDSTRLIRKSITMHREGDTKEDLIQGMDETEKSIRILGDCEDDDTTKFTYMLPKENLFNKESASLGIEEFIKNITKVLIFKPNLKTAKLIINGNLTWTKRRGTISFARRSSVKVNADLEEITISEANTLTKKIYKHVYIIANKLMNFENDGFESFEFSVTGAIEVDKVNKKIIAEESQKRNMVYITFPVLGFESFDFPIYINSNQLNPLTERNGLHLRGPSVKNCSFGPKKVNYLTFYGENQLIFFSFIQIFDAIVKYCADNQMRNTYCLLRGLNPSNINKDQIFDNDSFNWYKEHIINKFQSIIISQPVLLTNNGFMKILTQSCDEPKGSLISYDHETDEAQQRKYYDIIVKSNVVQNIPSFEDSLYWYNAFWDENYFISLETFCIKVSNTVKVLSFMNEFIEYLNKGHQEML